MNDYFDMIAELKELQSLYNTGELRNFDFERMIQKYEREINRFEQALEDMFENVPV